MSDDNAWDPPIPALQNRMLHVMVRDTKTGESLFSGNVQAAVAREALSGALRAAEGAWVPPSATPVSDGLYRVPGGHPKAVQAVTEAFLDALGDDHPALRVTVVRVQSL